MTEVALDAEIQDIGNASDQQLLSVILQELKNVKKQNVELREELNDLKKIVQGGKQPDEHLKVLGPQGGVGHPAIGKVMKAAKDGGQHSGVEAGQVENILDAEGFDRTRKSVLNIMRKIADNFPPFKFRKGNSSRGSQLHYQP